MTITDPSPLLSEIDLDIWNEYKSLRAKRNTRRSNQIETTEHFSTVEPNFPIRSPTSGKAINISNEPLDTTASSSQSHQNEIKSNVVCLGDFIDTDAVSIASD